MKQLLFIQAQQLSVCLPGCGSKLRSPHVDAASILKIQDAGCYLPSPDFVFLLAVPHEWSSFNHSIVTSTFGIL